MSNQPRWAFVANLGDVNALDHGGYLVYRDLTGVYPPEAVVIEPRDHDGVPQGERGRSWYVTRFVLEPCTFASGVLSDNPYHPDKPAWFADRISDVAEYAGDTPENLIAQLCSDDPIHRARGYEAIGRYCGFHEFSDEEIVIGRTEMRRRFRVLFPRKRKAHTAVQ